MIYWLCLHSKGTHDCNSAQSCLWFSQGCSIGCKSCDGNGTRLPNWDHCPGESIRPTLNDPKYRTANRNATAGSPEDVWKYVWKYREITTPPGQPVCVCVSLSRRLARSFYADLISFLMAPYVGRYQPWRAPGQAPVFDPCGMAGGVQTEAANGGTYNTTKYAKQGDLGSKVLKPRPTGMFQ